MVERNSLPLLPLAQGAATPLRPWRSANRIGARSPIVFMSRSASAPPPELGM
jgi:hypothetical protein